VLQNIVAALPFLLQLQKYGDFSHQARGKPLKMKLGVYNDSSLYDLVHLCNVINRKAY